MAVATGISPSVWAAEDERVVATAYDLLADAHETAKDAARDAQRRR